MGMDFIIAFPKRSIMVINYSLERIKPIKSTFQSRLRLYQNYRKIGRLDREIDTITRFQMPCFIYGMVQSKSSNNLLKGESYDRANSTTT